MQQSQNLRHSNQRKGVRKKHYARKARKENEQCRKQTKSDPHTSVPSEEYR